jgi:hypothetical protein
MKKNKPLLFLAIPLLGLSIRGKAQEAVVSAGGDASASSGNFSYTIGQVNYVTNSGGGFSSAEGVQQPYELSVVSGFENHQIDLQMALFPIPTSGSVYLTLDFVKVNNAQYKLIDVLGKVIASKEIESPRTEIMLGDYASGTYFLQVLIDNKNVKEFKIIKN